MSQPSEIITREKFIQGFLAGLIFLGIKTLHLTKRATLYEAFYLAWTETDAKAFRGMKESTTVDFDPLYRNYSRWLEEGVLSACRNLVATFRGGLKLDINFTEKEAEM